MFAAGLLSEATATGALLAAYWICMIVGGGLLLVSVLGGHGSDTDVDVDAGLDADVDVGAGFDTDVHADFDTDLHTDFQADGALDADVDSAAHAEHLAAGHGGIAGLSTWFSMRFVVFFLAVFGLPR